MASLKNKKNTTTPNKTNYELVNHIFFITPQLTDMLMLQ